MIKPLFLLGVCSIILISFMGGFVLGIIGLILGIIGLSEIKRLNQEGKLIVIFGIVCSSLSILLPILLANLVYLNADSSTISYLQAGLLNKRLCPYRTSGSLYYSKDLAETENYGGVKCTSGLVACYLFVCSSLVDV